MRHATLCAIILGSVCSSPASAASLRDYDFHSYYLAFPEYAECARQEAEACKGQPAESCPPSIDLAIEYTQTNPQLAVINGSSCLTGTAGPDIQDIYRMGEDGHPKKLSLPPIDESATGQLFGNRNYTMAWENNQLVERYNDTSGRPDPLVIRYDWKDGAFSLAEIVAAPSYQTSYDCATATEEHEKAICYVPELAALDTQLAAIYKSRLATLAGDEKAAFIQQQKNWLENRNKECTMYKWWVECLAGEYRDRIADLE